MHVCLDDWLLQAATYRILLQNRDSLIICGESRPGTQHSKVESHIVASVCLPGHLFPFDLILVTPFQGQLRKTHS